MKKRMTAKTPAKEKQYFIAYNNNRERERAINKQGQRNLASC